MRLFPAAPAPLAALSILSILAACSGDPVSSTPTPAGDPGATADAAGGDGGNPADSGAAGDTAITLNFEGRIGAAPFSCTVPATDLGTDHATVEPLDFRVYVHDVRLIGAAGDVPVTIADDGKWQVKGIALLDFEDKSGTCSNGTTDVNTSIRGAAPAGTYTGVKFKIGVPFDVNHANVATAPSPLNLSGLFWNWNGGYKFVRIDGRSPGVGDAGPSAFNIHLGSTGCQGDPMNGGAVTACDKPNIGEVVLTGFDPTAKKIIADYKSLVAGSALATDQGGAPGCMSGPTDPECASILARLGVHPTTGQPDPSQQALFRVE